MFEKVHYVSVNKRNGHQLLIHMSILYVKDVVTLLNPGSWRGECSWESGESAVEAECDTQTIEVEDEIQVATMPSSYHVHDSSIRIYPNDSFQTNNKVGKTHKLSLTQHQVSFVK